jgi:hypothetical protein
MDQIGSLSMQGKSVRTAVPKGRKLATVKNPELAALYRRLPYATALSREAKKAAIEKPSEKASEKSAELDQLVGTIIRRINKILG